jgi:hypothetical protein
MAVFAYSEAVRHLEQALKILEVIDPDDKLRRCDLLIALGEAMLPLEEPQRVADTVAEEAFMLAEALGDSQRAARVAVQAIEAFNRTVSSGPLYGLKEYVDWASRADRHAQDGTVERVYADIASGLHVAITIGPAANHALIRKAVGLALELQDPSPFFRAAGSVLGGMTSLADRELTDRIITEVASRPHEGVRSRDLAECLRSAAPAPLCSPAATAAERKPPGENLGS